MSYKAEFGANWQHLLASTVGMSLGLALNSYTMSLFAPALIAEFGWSRAQFALIGSTPFVLLLFLPFLGRFVDRVGPRNAAAVGFLFLPIAYVAISLMTGSFYLFFALTVIKSIFGVLTTTMVFARVVVERFDRARGFALSIVMSGPPLIGALAVPLIGELISEYGWRNAFRALAVISIVGGLIALTLLGRGTQPKKVRQVKFQRSEMIALMKSRLFLLTMGGIFLVNLPQVLVASQLKLVLQESGSTGMLATWIVSLYAAGVAVGRFVSGLALDRMEVHHVAILALGLPAVGLVVLGSPFDLPWLLAGSVLLIALAQGAEGDIGAYLVSRKFAIKNYSLLMSFMTAGLTIGAATGSLILSFTLSRTESYTTFLYISAVATVIGALLFFLTGRHPAEAGAEPALPAPGRA